MELTGIGTPTNVYGFLTAVVVCLAWVAEKLWQRRNGKNIGQPHPNGKLVSKSDLELAIARHQEDCTVGRRIEVRLDTMDGRLDRMDGRLDRIEEKMDERFARLEDAIRELWRAQAERGR